MLSTLQDRAKALVTENATTILTAVGVVGTVTTAVLTGRAAFKAADIVRDEELKEIQDEIEAQDRAERDSGNGHPMGLDTWDRTKLVWPLFVPPVLSGAITIGSIVWANRMSAQKAAALAAIYGVAQGQADDYKAKLEEKLGLKKSEEARAEIQQERVNQHPPDRVIVIGQGDVTCYDSYSDRYFRTTAEKIRQAEQAVQREILNVNEASLQRFYDELDWPPIGVSNDVGWNLNHPCSVVIDTVLMNESDPVLAIEFTELPIFGYDVKY